MVKQVPAKFKSSDGREFDDEQQAQAHEELIEAERSYKEARRTYACLLAESQKTADGVPFRFTVMHDYWELCGWLGLPRLRKVDFWFGNCDLNDRDETEIIQWREGVQGGQMVHHRIRELYYHERNAQAALLEAQRKYIADVTQEVEGLAARLAEKKG